MKLKKILAVVSAAALASVMAVVASAETYEVPAEYIKDAGDGTATVYLAGDETKGENGPFTDNMAELAKYTTVTFTIQLDEAEAADCAGGGETWVGGGVGFNSESTGWESHEWTPKAYEVGEDGNPVDADGDGTPDPLKEITLTKVSDGVYQAVYTDPDGSIFAETDTYAQLWMQDWSTKNAVLTGVTLSDGNDAPTTEEPTTEEPTTEEPTTEEPTTEEPATEPETQAPTTGLAGVALVGLALSGAAAVAAKKRK